MRKNWRIFSFTAGSRSLRQTMGSSGSLGDSQITRTLSATVGWPFWRFCSSRSRCRRSAVELLVATSSTPLATAKRLAWWLAARTWAKQVSGSMPRGANR
ncbi:MAG: hypothetical protein A2882_13125 [Phenylobacterium sp. RIFCSPHIGHO2_01_FULL_70_10]|nr:MAG: hypothetical protein A2882_13125 [Phenylobacterium sp. RIFCSPHIGHO2_01_FULL_70_10]